MTERKNDQARLDQELGRLAAATADLDADDRFSDAVLRATSVAADPLVRIARVTAHIEPDAALTDAVFHALRSAPSPARPAVADSIVRSGRAAIVLAALAAAASVLFFFQTQRKLDSAVMASVDTIEVSE